MGVYPSPRWKLHQSYSVDNNRFRSNIKEKLFEMLRKMDRVIRWERQGFIEWSRDTIRTRNSTCERSHLRTRGKSRVGHLIEGLRPKALLRTFIIFASSLNQICNKHPCVLSFVAKRLVWISYFVRIRVVWVAGRLIKSGENNAKDESKSIS